VDSRRRPLPAMRIRPDKYLRLDLRVHKLLRDVPCTTSPPWILIAEDLRDDVHHEHLPDPHSGKIIAYATPVDRSA
jgi:hypothetical protein